MSSRRLFSNGSRPRGRPSVASSSSAQPNNAPVELPEYEPPSCPLDAKSRQALAELSNDQDTRKYSDHIAKSLEFLKKSVGAINDRYADRKDDLQKVQSKRREKGDDAGEKTDQERALEEAVAALRAEVPELTTNSDMAVRELIDWQGDLQDGKSAMEEVKRKVEHESANAVLAQARAVDDEDEEANESPDITGPLRFLAEEKEKLANDYYAKTAYERYGLHNDYIAFKKVWHDSIHGKEGKPLPNAARWFNDDEEGGEEDADEDVVISEEVVDLRCPLSMQIMKEPYTSRNCKHTYEKAHIYGYLNPHPNKTTQCPQTGCNKMVSKSDLYLDEIILRKIKRAQARENDRDSEEDDDVADGDGDSMQVTQERQIKSERRERGRRQIVDDAEDE
ncbi:zinc-finger of the MIZ type in Nse subunit-domain-containing protein [Pseudomassariella vexata]|uniref:Zinc-finger of the MIZ type in Nse subunit-domain-containing protein n=1 Tax=Pseudomassariella vexata TaxID=1141098 RepID=A0A1Y2DRD3_9PEZI|nr:zinc-finger of the MIZ type in Nse subunit-domain-containing protein [Pseudomassariella vexata]ORY61235.1 zinc-finger of the MIZ type in Nse subunit-domain-containing protein [Pseudomassariella vexata]